MIWVISMLPVWIPHNSWRPPRWKYSLTVNLLSSCCCGAVSLNLYRCTRGIFRFVFYMSPSLQESYQAPSLGYRRDRPALRTLDHQTRVRSSIRRPGLRFNWQRLLVQSVARQSGRVYLCLRKVSSLRLVGPQGCPLYRDPLRAR